MGGGGRELGELGELIMFGAKGELCLGDVGVGVGGYLSAVAVDGWGWGLIGLRDLCLVGIIGPC